MELDIDEVREGFDATDFWSLDELKDYIDFDYEAELWAVDNGYVKVHPGASKDAEYHHDVNEHVGPVRYCSSPVCRALLEAGDGV